MKSRGAPKGVNSTPACWPYLRARYSIGNRTDRSYLSRFSPGRSVALIAYWGRAYDGENIHRTSSSVCPPTLAGQRVPCGRDSLAICGKRKRSFELPATRLGVHFDHEAGPKRRSRISSGWPVTRSNPRPMHRKSSSGHVPFCHEADRLIQSVRDQRVQDRLTGPPLVQSPPAAPCHRPVSRSQHPE